MNAANPIAVGLSDSSPVGVGTLQAAEVPVTGTFVFQAPIPRRNELTANSATAPSYFAVALPGPPLHAISANALDTHVVAAYNREISMQREQVSEPLRVLRMGLAWLLLLATLGVSVSLWNKGLGLALVYGGLLILLVKSYGYGISTGDYLVSPRYSILGIVALVGLVLTALVAAIEVLVQRGL